MRERTGLREVDPQQQRQNGHERQPKKRERQQAAEETDAPAHAARLAPFAQPSRRAWCAPRLQRFRRASRQGIEALTAAHPDVEIFTAAIDEELNEQFYIVPGLGDAGDRIYGTA